MLAAFSASLWLISNFPPYRGDGVLADHGFFRWGGYRYEITFGSFTFEKESHKIYKFSGVPSEKYGISLKVLPNDGRKYPYTSSDFDSVVHALNTAKTKIEVRLVSDEEDYIHLERAGIDEDWVRSSWFFWNQSFANTQLSRYKQYELHLTIVSEEFLTEPIVFQPSVFGGYKIAF